MVMAHSTVASTHGPIYADYELALPLPHIHRQVKILIDPNNLSGCRE